VRCDQSRIKNDTVSRSSIVHGQILPHTEWRAKWDTVFGYDVGNAGWTDGVTFIGANRDTAIAIGDADANGIMVARARMPERHGPVRPVFPLRCWKRLDGPRMQPTVQLCRAMARQFGRRWRYYGSTKNPIILKSTDAGGTWTEIDCVLPGGTTLNYYFVQSP